MKINVPEGARLILDGCTIDGADAEVLDITGKGERVITHCFITGFKGIDLGSNSNTANNVQVYSKLED